MKVRIEIDCTPEEAKAFANMPDLKPLQDAVVSAVTEQMVDNPLHAFNALWGKFLPRSAS